MTYLKDPYTFHKNSWLKRQNPFAQSCAHDVINSAGSSLCDTLRYATVMAKINLGESHVLAVFSDFSAVFALDLQNQGKYMILPDPVRVKKHNNGIHLMLENIRMHGSQKRLRVQVKNQVSEEYQNINFQHPFLQAIVPDAQTLLKGLKANPAPLLHSDWDHWSPEQVRPWQNPTMTPKREQHFHTVAKFFLEHFGVDKNISLNLPVWQNANVTPFSSQNTLSQNSPAVNAVLACLNDPELGPKTQFVSNAKQMITVLKGKPDHLSGHTKIKLLRIAQKHMLDA